SGGRRLPIGRQLREAENEVVRLTRRRDGIIESLAAASAYEELRRLGDALAVTQAELEKAEDAWLALAEEAESPT
ncbi:MAG TPA: hypothetical protein VN799_05255, partial [Acidimicrobiales bacterium]|nr:hypothetical protein [Acidimicrobiales bacterium]